MHKSERRNQTFVYAFLNRFSVSDISNFSFYRLWDIECGACLRVLEGHEELVRCIRFDGKRIVSGAYDGKIKVWDLKIAMDPRASSSTICIKTLVVSLIYMCYEIYIYFLAT